MSIQDRDWYREEIANRTRQSNPSPNHPPLRPRPKTVLRPRLVASIAASIVASIAVSLVALCGTCAFLTRLHQGDTRTHSFQAPPPPTAARPSAIAIAPPLRASEDAARAVATRRPTEQTTAPSRLCSSQAKAAMDSGAPPETLRGDWLQRCRLYVADLPPDVRLWTLRDPADF